jgi:hypothetical protein
VRNLLVVARRHGFRTGRRFAACAAALAVLVACSQRQPPPRLPLPVAAQAWIPALPATHEPRSAALAVGDLQGQSRTSSKARDDAFRDYLATLSRNGPISRPELFPTGDDVLAYLVDAHIAWALALGRNSEFAGLEVAALRDTPIPVDGRTTSLAGLAAEIAARAPWEPRLALFLNPGWHGGPPLPTTAVEGRSLEWQLSLQAERCGKAPGFWSLDAANKKLGVSMYTELMWGLPLDRPSRVRRLLELVPPPKRLLDGVVEACGAALQHCDLTLAPIDFGRLLTPEPLPGGSGIGGRRP